MFVVFSSLDRARTRAREQLLRPLAVAHTGRRCRSSVGFKTTDKRSHVTLNCFVAALCLLFDSSRRRAPCGRVKGHGSQLCLTLYVISPRYSDTADVDNSWSVFKKKAPDEL